MGDLGPRRRLARLFNAETKRTLIVPIDDALLAGPELGLRNAGRITHEIRVGRADAVMAFRGLFERSGEEILSLGQILNVTASTTRSAHTRKVQVSSVEDAVTLGVDCVAVHVNIGSKYETEMLGILGKVSSRCNALGMPLMGIMYPRSEKDSTDYNYLDLKAKHPGKFAELVRHAARVGVELGADIIKTQYTGDAESFMTVVESCSPVPVVIAGGPKVNAKEILRTVHGAIEAGASGVSIGRNVFQREEPAKFVSALRAIIHEGKSVERVLEDMSLASLA